ncbi:MAG: ATP-binding protein [Bacteroidota bacterium]
MSIILQKEKIELRLFEICQLLTIGVLLFWSIFSFVASYTLVIKLIYLGSLAAYGAIYLGFKRNLRFKSLVIAYYSLAFILLILAWLPAGGITGPILHMFVLIYASGLLVLPPKSYLTFIISTLVVVVAFSVFEINFPLAAVPYTNEANRIRDISTGSILMITMLGYILYLFKKSYIEDRYMLNKAIAESEAAKEIAESADRSKTKFLATISHEMRTPLNGIIGLSELLERTNLNKEQSEILSGLIYSSDLLHSLISDVLDLTLIEDDKLVLQENEIAISEEVESIIEIFKRRLESKSGNISLSYNHDPTIPTDLYHDITRFRQILINLINNAVKFTEDGYVVVKSQLKELSTKEALLEFSVTDTGTGIPEDKKEHIFNKFYKASEDTTIEGTGLGLSICRNLVHAMNGKIDFESEEGVGTTFYFEIPFRRNAISRMSDSDDQNEEGSYHDLNVLVAEDVKINQMVISKMLTNLGVSSFVIAQNGLEAVHMAEKEDYDFILMDVQMPEKNGIEAAREILAARKNEEHQPLIVAVTANVMSGEKQECERAGMSDFISKPITSEMLKEVFDKHLKV